MLLGRCAVVLWCLLLVLVVIIARSIMASVLRISVAIVMVFFLLFLLFVSTVHEGFEFLEERHTEALDTQVIGGLMWLLETNA